MSESIEATIEAACTILSVKLASEKLAMSAVRVLERFVTAYARMARKAIQCERKKHGC